ncbi:MAG: P-II family nitrogen regulator [Nitrososphaeraceae archaeon]
MKRIEIIIPHEKLEHVDNILENFKVGGMSFYHINGRGKTKWEPMPVGRGVMMYTPKFGARTKIEVLVDNNIVKDIINRILTELTTGSVSDGKIFVYDVLEAYDIGTQKWTGNINLFSSQYSNTIRKFFINRTYTVI